MYQCLKIEMNKYNSNRPLINLIKIYFIKFKIYLMIDNCLNIEDRLFYIIYIYIYIYLYIHLYINLERFFL